MRGTPIRQAVLPTSSQYRASTSNRTASFAREAFRASSTVVSPDSHLTDRPALEASDRGDQSQASDDNVLQETIMALDMRENATIGCAYFTTLNSTLFLSEDIPMANMDIVEQFLIYAQPTTLLVSARAPEQFNDYVEKQTGSPDLGTQYPEGHWDQGY